MSTDASETLPSAQRQYSPIWHWHFFARGSARHHRAASANGWQADQPSGSACALGAARAGDVVGAREALARLAAIRDTLLEQKNSYWAGQVDIQFLAVAAWGHALNDQEKALKYMRGAAEYEARTEKHPVTPGAILPAREQLAEMLLGYGLRNEALAEAERVLGEAPNRRNALQIAARAREGWN